MRKDQTPPKTRRTRNVEAGTEPVARRGRPTGDHDAKRAALLKAAISVIAQEGYAAASLRKVAQRAEQTTGAVTYYFANRGEMVTAVAESVFDEFDALLRAADQQVDVKVLLQQWLSLTEADEPDLWLALFQLLAHARHEPAFTAVVRRRYAHFRQRFTAILERGQQQGTVRKDIAAELLADQLSAMSDGWSMMFPIEPKRFKPERLRALLEATARLISP
jgi:AcrR family transcriptional regulator